MVVKDVAVRQQTLGLRPDEVQMLLLVEIEAVTQRIQDLERQKRQQQAAKHPWLSKLRAGGGNR